MRVDFRCVAKCASFSLWVSLVACSAADSDPGTTGSGSGAASGDGASTGSGGTGSGVGGSGTGSGGTTATGTGGSTSAGGTTATAAGGSSTAGTGGAAGGAGGGEPVFSYTFDADVQGFTILTGEGASTPAELQDEAMASFAAASGDPAPGALSLNVPFDAASQNVAVSLAFAGPLDLTGKTLTARVRLVSGMTQDGENPGGIMLFVKGGADWKLAQSAWHNAGAADAGVWSTLTLTPSTPAADDFFEEGFSVTDVKMIGITVATGGTGTMYEAAAIEIDSISAQ